MKWESRNQKLQTHGLGIRAPGCIVSSSLPLLHVCLQRLVLTHTRDLACSENERKLRPKGVFKDTRQSLQDRCRVGTGFCVQEKEMESLTNGGWRQVSANRSCVQGKRVLLVLCSYRLPCILYRVFRGFSSLRVSPMPCVLGQLCSSTAIPCCHFCSGL